MYVKVFSDIVNSSIWAEDAETCKIWVTLLTLCNADGIVRATAPGISNASRVNIEKTRQVIALLESPDPESRTPDNEGRRIERVDGGYLVLNYMKYRNLVDADKRREQTRLRVAAYRERKAEKDADSVTVTPVTQSNAKKKKKKNKKEHIVETENGSHETDKSLSNFTKDELSILRALWKNIAAVHECAKPPKQNSKEWFKDAAVIQQLTRLDKIPVDHVKETFRWLYHTTNSKQADFWRGTVQCVQGLRKSKSRGEPHKFAKIYHDAVKEAGLGETPEEYAEVERLNALAARINEQGEL